MNQNILPTDNSVQEKKANRALMVTMGVVVLAVAIIAIAGLLMMNHPDEVVEGQIEGTTVRVSGKLPGRVVEFFVEEGDTVAAGDTLVRIHSSVMEAQMTEARAMQQVAEAQNRKVDSGTRSQIIQAAADMVSQATAAVEITRKTYERMENLFREGVVSAQKRDEAKAAYDAAVAARNAAESNLSLARAGAQIEDKESTSALVQAAGGGVAQVQAVLDDSYLVAPCDGTIDIIYPEPGELVAMGTPIMTILQSGKRWVTFNVREELLNDMKMGQEIDVMIPALDRRHIKARIYYVRDMGTYATWRSTKSNGSWDSRTFQIKARPVEGTEDLRPGMSAIYDK